ncbi:hypothetical protein WR25_18561 [Diploscapter pachys]|uniref:EndoU domain-containing protein n=1 Tax=Diploscapter pachys TaxID=2018661 RepID=A0A2A2K8V0_9BILA|nr:hypothetical protein WR25_18561 [Diploscapter pachys]
MIRHIFVIGLLIADVCHAASESIPAFKVSDQELVDIVNKMRDLDENKAKKGQIVVDYQGHTFTRDATDNAPKKFFSKVDASLLRKPTYEQYLAMMNNFNRQTGIREPNVSANEEKQETSAFLSAVLQSKPWKALFDFFKSKGHPVATSDTSFRHWVGQLWFDHYSRARGQADTSGFEHIFIGEARIFF